MHTRVLLEYAYFVRRRLVPAYERSATNGRRTDRTIKSWARILLLILASTPAVATPSMHNIIMDIVLTGVCIHYLDCLYYSSMHTLVLPLY